MSRTKRPARARAEQKLREENRDAVRAWFGRSGANDAKKNERPGDLESGGELVPDGEDTSDTRAK